MQRSWQNKEYRKENTVKVHKLCSQTHTCFEYVDRHVGGSTLIWRHGKEIFHFRPTRTCVLEQM